jgi:prephenate dehydrogenase
MRLGIVGLGLIGGSLGLAVRELRPDVDVVGVARRNETARGAERRGAVHRAGTELGDLRDVDLVVVAAPLGATEEVLQGLASTLPPGVAVTDVGSVKASVVAAAGRILGTSEAAPDEVRNPFLGGHPMAGKEVGGIDNAEAALFAGKPWIFTPAMATDAGSRAEVGAVGLEIFDEFRGVVRDIGALVMDMAPEEHDRRVALVSHLPFLLSATYLLAAGRDEVWEQASPLASSGFRDVTRVGAGDPAMYAAIVEANLPAIREAWAAMNLAMEEMESAFERGEHRHLLELFARARQVRRGWEAGLPHAAGR